jgi:hypothetical protein
LDNDSSKSNIYKFAFTFCTKTSNNELKAQLNELRKETMINQARLEESTKVLEKESKELLWNFIDKIHLNI